MPPASAGSESTADSGRHASGPLPVSALAHALANSESQPADTNESQVLPGDPGQAQAPAAQASEQPANTEEQQSTAEENAQDAGQEQVEAQGPETAGEEASSPQPSPPEEEREDGQEESPGVQKRIGRLQNRIRELEAKLANTAGAAPSPTIPATVLNVTEPGELARLEEDTEAGIEEVDSLMAQLSVVPTRVEQYLRNSGVVLKDAQGQEDYSTERMVDCLTAAKSKLRQTLKAIPKRLQYLQDYKQAHEQTVKVLPWIADVGDERQAMLDTIANQFPTLKSQPNWEYWVGCAIEGHLSIAKRRAQPNGRPNGNSNSPSPRPSPRGEGGAAPRQVARAMPRSGGAGSARVVPRAEQANLQTAKQRVLKEGTRSALGAFLGAVQRS